MAFARNIYDGKTTTEILREQTYINRYMLDVPGPGNNLPFIDDPFIRIQKWRGNLMTNIVSVEGDLLGLTRNLNKDSIKDNNYIDHAVKTKSVNYPVVNPLTEQPRATHPAWTDREIDQSNWNILSKNQQSNVFMKFDNNIDTRLNEIEMYQKNRT
jgi:hypothetical protein